METIMLKMSATLVLATLILAGCTSTGGKVETAYTEPDFSTADLREGSLAIGGVVLGDKVEVDAHAGIPAMFSTDDQSLEWGPALAAGVMTKAPDVTLMSYVAVRDQVPAGFLANIQGTYARRGLIKPEALTRVAENLPGTNWLLLARVDASILEGESVYEGKSTQGGQSVNSGSSDQTDLGTLPHETGEVEREVGMFGTVGRTVRMTLDIYDLRQQRSVWTGSVERHHKAPGGPRTADEDRKLQLDDSGATPVVAGSSLAAPALEPVVADCCQDLSGSLAEETPRD